MCRKPRRAFGHLQQNLPFCWPEEVEKFMSPPRSRFPLQLYLDTVRCWSAISDRGVGIPEDGPHHWDASANTERRARSSSLPSRLLPACGGQPAAGERGRILARIVATSSVAAPNRRRRMRLLRNAGIGDESPHRQALPPCPPGGGCDKVLQAIGAALFRPLV